MMENVATLIIIVSPFLLFVYWFRYACLLILTAKTARDYAGAVATANQLDFPKVQLKLRNQAVDLDRLKDALNRDYELLIYLLKNAPNPPIGEAAIEDRILEIYYRFMCAWYNVADLDRLKDALDRDYRLLTYLLKNAPNLPTGEAAIEERMLEVYYRLMRAWYSAANHFSPPAAGRALGEMSIVLAHFANTIGERVAVQP